MEYFLITLTSVAVMLFYAIPGFIFIKSGAIKEDAISAFAKLLMYLCSPCLTIYSFSGSTCSVKLLKEMAILLVLSLFLQIAMLGIFYFLFRKKIHNVKYRIYILGTTFGNCAFMGVPLLEAIMPDHPEAIVMSTAYFAGMSLLGWTVGSGLITGDRKYVSVKKALLNPAILALLAAFPLFLTGTRLPKQLNDMITLLSKMTTPLCMLVMGMRLATMDFRKLFMGKLQYFTVFVKQILMPLAALCIINLLPVDLYLKQTFFILCATPVASVVLNFAEMLGEGQDTAANVVLLGTMMSIITIPLMMLLC